MLEKRADASDTSVVFFPFAVLIFCLWILFLLNLLKMPNKNVLVPIYSAYNHLTNKLG